MIVMVYGANNNSWVTRVFTCIQMPRATIPMTYRNWEWNTIPKKDQKGECRKTLKQRFKGVKKQHENKTKFACDKEGGRHPLFSNMAANGWFEYTCWWVATTKATRTWNYQYRDYRVILNISIPSSFSLSFVLIMLFIIIILTMTKTKIIVDNSR